MSTADWNPPSPAESLSPTDLEDVQAQLGYVPQNLLRIVAREEDSGKPAVLLLYPLNNALGKYKANQRQTMEPFPTIYWLCSPTLKEKISRLEAEGYINAFQKRLEANPTLLRELEENHRAYARQRIELLRESDLELLKTRGLYERMATIGVAGMSSPHGVKCLHAHYAHFLGSSSESLVGRWVHELLQNLDVDS